jgi:Ca-activated chloride channel family protein
MFRFATPVYLLLLGLIPLLALMPAFRRRRQPASMTFSSTQLLTGNGVSWRVTGRRWLPAVRFLALAFLVVALARPQLGESRQIIQGQGIDIALALDISSSMGIPDFLPATRLEAAKQVIADFIEERPFDRIGLVVFAQDAFSQAPPTTDHNILSRMLRNITTAPELRLEDGTAIGMGLATAVNMLKDSEADSKVVILLTDGINNAGQIAPQTAAAAAETLGITVYTIGAGRPSFNNQNTSLDEETLTAIAEATGGLYFRAQDVEGLRQIYAQINELEKSEVDIRVFTNYEELMGAWLTGGILLLLMELVLRKTVFKTIP